MDSDALGPRLKAAREARGLPLSEIAATTKIAPAALEALERGDYSRLPGGIYARAFIRAYAAQVGLDPETAVREFVGEVSALEREAARIRIRPAVSPDDKAFLERQQRALRAFRLIAIGLALALAALAAWLLWSYAPDQARSDAVNAPPAAPARPPITPPPPADPLPPRQESPETPAPVQRDRLTVSFRVTGACWVQVTADGLVVLSRLMQSGERETITADRDLVLDVGNAGVFSWSINGQPAQSLGRDGRHRQVTVTRENARTFLR
jgi:cytoskeletal protein RodZ